MASIIRLRRRVERLTANADAEVLAYIRTLTPDGWSRLFVALRAAGIPLPDGNDPFSLSDSGRQAWLAEAERLAALVGDYPRLDGIVRTTVQRLRLESRCEHFKMAQNGSGWRN